MTRIAGPTAALAGTPAGVQAQGIWTGRRQLFIRFAAEAETAVMYTAQALGQELKRLVGKSAFHSVAVSGRDTLGNVEYLSAVFEVWTPTLPVLLETDGQRPGSVTELRESLTVVQVTLEAHAATAVVERALQTLRSATECGLEHALVILATDQASDGQLLRIVEQAHATSGETAIVVHPSVQADSAGLDRRWSVLLEQITALHGDTRLLMRIPPPTGMR